MTNTVIIDTRVRRTPTVRRPVVLPRLKTFMAQAIAGSVFSHFVLLLLACLTATDQLGFWLIALPFFLFLSLFGGVPVFDCPAGCLSWLVLLKLDCVRDVCYREAVAVGVASASGDNHRLAHALASACRA